MRLYVSTLLAAWLTVNLGVNAGPVERKAVKWEKAASLSRNEIALYETRAYEILNILGVDVSQFAKIDGCFEQRDESNLPLDLIRLSFWKSQRDIDVAFIYPPKDGIRSFIDFSMSQRGDAPDSHIPVKTTRDQALKRAKEIARLIGSVNVDDSTKWQLCSLSFVRSDWLLSWRPLVFGYPAPSVLTVVLADDEQLSLVRFSNGVISLPKVNTDVGIDQHDARKLADKYLNQYYHKHELKTLVFSTNVLEIIVPNYSFTPQDTGYQGWANPTNPPILMWKTVYNRKNNTTVRTPVEIWVDAIDGSMRGGWE